MAALAKAVPLTTKLLRKQLAACGVPVRWLNLQEYQSKKLMADHGIAVQRFEIIQSSEQAQDVCQRLKADEYVVKAQILAGGRGKGVFSSGFKGGVQLTKDESKVPTLVNEMLGYNLVTKQTPKDGVKVQTVMVAEALDIARETYLAILMDRKYSGPVVIGCAQGGMDIEEVAETNPDAIFKEPVDIMTGITEEQAMRMAENLEFTGAHRKEAAVQIKRLYEMFVKVDATQVEINPFGETPDGKVVCFDAKINFDDNAAFRQREIFDQEDVSEKDPREVEAAKQNLNYIGLEGTIGCLVNGAGLAMATMDMVKLHGGEPANFLDLGGSASEDQVYQAFKILTADEHVKAIFVNVFGGIMNCATIANGIINSYNKISMNLPMVIRLEGTNVDEARRILQESGLPLIAINDFEAAAEKAVQCQWQ